MGNILCCDVIYDLIKVKAHVQNCKASDWSDCVVLVGHMIICLFSLTLIGLEWSYDQNKVPLQFSTELSSSGGIFFKRILLFLLKLV